MDYQQWFLWFQSLFSHFSRNFEDHPEVKSVTLLGSRGKDKNTEGIRTLEKNLNAKRYHVLRYSMQFSFVQDHI